MTASSCKKREKEPTVTELIGIGEMFFEEPLRGTITKKGIWLDITIDVTILGECGALYLYSDGIKRFSEPGRHYIALRNGKDIPEKIPASKVTLL